LVEGNNVATNERDNLKHTNPLSYIDLLILTLTQHEKNLSLIIEKLERISDKLEEISQQLTEERKNT